MRPTELLNHLLNFLAPALTVALLLPIASRIIFRKVAVRRSLLAQSTILFVANSALLGACLRGLGQDGKMVTYGLLIVTAACVQWALLGKWRA